MVKDIERKKKIQNLRLKLLINIKDLLEGYKKLGDENFLILAKELGRDSERLKAILNKLK